MIRTDFTDEVAWRRIVAVLLDDHECQIIDDPAFAGATADELARVAGDVQPEVVFVADTEAMRDERALLAFTTRRPEWFSDAADRDRYFAHGYQLRILPSLVDTMHRDLVLTNIGFGQYTSSASTHPDRTYRGFRAPAGRRPWAGFAHACDPSALRRGEVLREGALVSPNGLFRLVNGGGRNKLMHSRKRICDLFRTSILGSGLHLDASGVLQARAYDGKVLSWVPATAVPQAGLAHALLVRDSGDVDLVDEDGATVWSSGTSGRIGPAAAAPGRKRPGSPGSGVRFCWVDPADSGPRGPAAGRPPVVWGELNDSNSCVVRTDFSDDEAWDEVVAQLQKPWGYDGEFEASHVILDDPAFAGATTEEVLALLPGDAWVPVVFIADATTMQGELPLLAVSTATPEDFPDMPEEYEDEMRHGRQCRVLPEAVAEMQSDSSNGRSFAEFAESAAHDTDHIHRGWS